jgi:hypothetical protein
MILLITIITFIVRILVFAYYSHCDPVVSKESIDITRYSLFTMDILGYIPEFQGFLLPACLALL